MSPAAPCSPVTSCTAYSPPTPWGDCDGPDLVNGLAPACRRGTGPQRSPVAPCIGLAGGSCIAGESAALSGGSIVDFGHALQALSDANQSAHGGPYFTDQTAFGALDQAMVNAGLTWCQRCQVLALHVSANASDNLDPISLLKLCYRGSSTNPNGDASLMSWQLPSVSSSSAPDPALRLDAYTCQTCPPTLSPDKNGQCTVQCPADVVIDGTVAPLGTTTWETTFSQLPASSDTCPAILILEVDHPDQFFARGGTAIEASDSVDSPSSQTCAQPFSLTFADSPPSASAYVNENTVSETGSYSSGSGPGGGIQGSPMCLNVPAITLAKTQLTYGPDPIRFIATVTSGVSLMLDVPTKGGGGPK